MSLQRLLDLDAAAPDPEDLYVRLDFPAPPADRPYVYINMVSTVDGKIVLGEPGESAAGVGGPTDQVLFRRLQRNAEGALVGASTLRASQVIYPTNIARFTATRSGNLPLDNRFFRDAPDRAYIVIPEKMARHDRDRLDAAAKLLPTGNDDVDWAAALRVMRQELDIHTLLCEGGSTLNGQLVLAGLADELFLTLSPKLKGGSHLPTILGGPGFPPGTALRLNLLSVYHDGDELYLRYRLSPSSSSFRRGAEPR